jgi:hypothetical protein
MVDETGSATMCAKWNAANFKKSKDLFAGVRSCNPVEIEVLRLESAEVRNPPAWHLG